MSDFISWMHVINTCHDYKQRLHGWVTLTKQTKDKKKEIQQIAQLSNNKISSAYKFMYICHETQNKN